MTKPSLPTIPEPSSVPSPKLKLVLSAMAGLSRSFLSLARGTIGAMELIRLNESQRFCTGLEGDSLPQREGYGVADLPGNSSWNGSTGNCQENLGICQLGFLMARVRPYGGSGFFGLKNSVPTVIEGQSQCKRPTTSADLVLSLIQHGARKISREVLTVSIQRDLNNSEVLFQLRENRVLSHGPAPADVFRHRRRGGLCGDRFDGVFSSLEPCNQLSWGGRSDLGRHEAEGSIGDVRE